MGADGVSLPAHQTEDFLTFELGRGADVSLVYQVPLGASGKHGQRGMVQEEYCVFDGGQALLLPMEFYQDGFPQDEAVVRSLRVSLKAREGWTAILPFEELQDVTWADAYNLNNDAFAMGNFAQYFPAEQTGGAAVYGVAGEEGQFPQEVASGIAALRAYYAERFGIEEQPYQIILLPTEEGDVIGGAGCTVYAQPLTRRTGGTGNCSAIACSTPISTMRSRHRPSMPRQTSGFTRDWRPIMRTPPWERCRRHSGKCWISAPNGSSTPV